MRRSAFIIAVTALVFVSCTEQGSMPAEDVLNRSSTANSGLLSARISMSARMTANDPITGPLDGSLNVQGNMQQGGHQLDLAFTTVGNGSSSAEPVSWEASGRLIVLSEDEAYIRLDGLETSPVLPILAVAGSEQLTGSWFRLPAAGQTSPTVTPDPRFLRLQSEAVRVTKDHGIDAIDGERFYHYDVAIDPVRLAAYLASLPDTEGSTPDELARTLEGYDATGELWIDEDTFLLTKAVWNIRKKDDETFLLQLTMNLSDAGLPVTVTAPEDVQPLPRMPLLPSADATILLEL